MKVSFLLPTKNSDREEKQFAGRVIDSINENCSHEKEILVFSPREISGENVTWYEEKVSSNGCIYGYNFLYKKSEGEYVFVANDEYMFANNSPDKAIKILESPYYKDRRFKILGMGSPIRSFPNGGHTNGYTCVPNFGNDSHRYRVCGYPAFHRQTIDECLNGYIFHPKLRHHYGDNFLPFYAGFMGEPINDCPASDLNLVGDINITYWDNDGYDSEIYEQLVKNLVERKELNYVSL